MSEPDKDSDAAKLRRKESELQMALDSAKLLQRRIDMIGGVAEHAVAEAVDAKDKYYLDDMPWRLMFQRAIKSLYAIGVLSGDELSERLAIMVGTTKQKEGCNDGQG